MLAAAVLAAAVLAAASLLLATNRVPIVDHAELPGCFPTAALTTARTAAFSATHHTRLPAAATPPPRRHPVRSPPGPPVDEPVDVHHLDVLEALHPRLEVIGDVIVIGDEVDGVRLIDA